MTSKKTPQEKRAKAPRRSDYTREFLKDWKRLTHSGRYNLHQAKAGMLLIIANDAPMPAEWLDHSLRGDWADHREFHAGGDFLVIYRLSDDDAAIFVRIGTHADLFE